MITYLNIGRMGRFANALFEIAGTIGIAVRSGQSYAFPLFINHDSRKFKDDEDIDVYKYFVHPLPLVPDDFVFNEYDYFWGYRDIVLHTGNWNMNAHFQSERYFSHCIDLVRHYFTMANEVDNEFTAIHMRFGDYDGNYHPRPDINYYSEAIKHAPGPYLLFSDDLVAAELIMDQITPSYESANYNYLDSFRIMKRCKHFICGNSSFPLMASILSNQPGKIVVCPKKWFGDHVGLETVDLYPYNSIVL